MAIPIRGEEVPRPTQVAMAAAAKNLKIARDRITDTVSHLIALRDKFDDLRLDFERIAHLAKTPQPAEES